MDFSKTHMTELDGSWNVLEKGAGGDLPKCLFQVLQEKESENTHRHSVIVTCER